MTSNDTDTAKVLEYDSALGFYRPRQVSSPAGVVAAQPERLTCPMCGNDSDFDYVELVPSYRNVVIDEDTGEVLVSGYSDEYYENSEDEHFQCRECRTDVSWSNYSYM